MVKKIFAKFIKLALFGIALLGFLVIVNRVARAETTNPAEPVWNRSNSYTVIVAQNETPTGTNDTRGSSTQSQESESKTDEKKESSDIKKKPLKDFKPSERIEVEQAVDFPYDI